MNRSEFNASKCLVHLGKSLREQATTRALSVIVLTFALAWYQGALAQHAATAVATVTNGSIASVVVTDSGSGYEAPPTVTFVGGGGAGASAIAQETNGVVNDIIIWTAGIGYTAAPTVAIDPPPAPITPAALSISMIPMLSISGQAWAVQQVQYATALGATAQWFTLTNIVLRNGPGVFIDTSAPPGERRFYQVVTLAAPGPDPARWAWINPGSFTMGSPITEYDRSDNEGPETEVTLSRGFWMGRYEVTEGEYTAVVGTNFSTFTGDTNQPVEEVQWYDASNYCALLTMQERAAGRVPAGYEYRLPTEAEWEYAARAGTTNRFFFGDDPTYTLLLNYAWVSTNSDQTAHDVGGKLPNSWGLYDTSGNLWEWCADWYGPYSGGSVSDPTGPSSGTNRVMRGGSWHFPGGDARSATRNFNPSDFASFGIGFRVALGQTGP